MKNKTLKIKCDCGCGSILQIFFDGDLWHIDASDPDKKNLWHGIVTKSIKKIVKLVSL